MNFPLLTSSLGLLRDVCLDVPDDRYDDPTPCSEWTVAQVMLHAAGDQHAWASAVGQGTAPAYNPFAPPTRPDGSFEDLLTAAIDAAAAAWARVDPTDQTVPTPLPPVPHLTAELAAAACAMDAAVHAWDIAVATTQRSPLTAELAKQLLPAAHATADPLRGFAYAAALPEQPGEDATAALLHYLGRDPNWAPGPRG
jgi:uncharacterized protein (TIGR03086 family)